MNFPDDRRYAESHEWAKNEGDSIVTIGISEHAQEALGDIVFVELPEVGQTLNAGDEFGVVESVKAASDLYSPVGGEVTEVNNSLEDAPEVINESPYEKGWIIKVKASDAAELDALHDAEAYKAMAEAEA